MSELHKELIEIAERLDKFSVIIADPVFKEPLDRLEDASNAVAKAWSGSWLGYHATVYYDNLQSPPPGTHFSNEWGLRGGLRTHKSATGKWREFSPEDVNEAIYQQAGNQNLAVPRMLSQEAAATFDNLKPEVISILTTSLSDRADPFLAKLKEEAEETGLLTQTDIIQALKPSGRLMSRDSLAVTQGLRVPPHILILAEVMALRNPTIACEKLAKIARKSGSHLIRKQGGKQKSQAIETNVFIGHGRSLIWRELKDFIQDSLRLPWDEFNRVPVAGVTNTTRLSEMLDAAAIAFLVMTGEDEQAGGELHARMNVVHEAGLFQGRLGFTRAIVLLEEGCKEFSNIHGLGQIRFPKGNIRAAFEEIRQVLHRERLLRNEDQ